MIRVRLGSARRAPALHHLARAAGSRYSPEDLFAMFTCYFDEAGGEDHGFTVVAGFMASVEQWDSFEIDWKLFLNKYDVSYLHMLEYAHFKGPFRKWKDPRFETTRRNFLCDAAEIIHSHVKRGFLCVVKHEYFCEAAALYPSLLYPNSPYALAGRTCATSAKTWVRKHLLKLDLELVFEDGGPDKHGLSDTLTKLNPRLPAPIFEPSRDMPDGRHGLVQLQAADWFAYEIRKWQVDRPDLQTPRKDVRKSLRALLDLPDIDMKTYGEKSCSQLAIDLKKMENGILAMKPSDEYENFNQAMNTILNADPQKVKALMDAEKKEPEERRGAKNEDSPKK